MKKHKFASDYDFENIINEYLPNDEPSQTVPDQAMSIAEIMRRYAQGLPLEGEKVPFYENEEDIDTGNNMPDVSRMDLVDRLQLAKDAKEHAQEMERQIREQLQREKKEKADQREKVQRTPGSEADQGEEDQPGKNNPGLKNFGPKADRSKGKTPPETSGNDD